MSAQPEPSSTDYQTVLSIVRSRFQVKEEFLREDGSVEVQIRPSPADKQNFAHIWHELRGRGLLAFMRRIGDDVVLAVGRGEFGRRFNTNMAIVLFAATVTTVFLDGWILSAGGALGGLNPIQMAALYTLSLLGILGLHEAGHKMAATRQGIRASLPYFIPGIPGSGVPTFGALIMSGEPSVNRDSLFDLAFAGPLLGLIVTLIVAFPGSLTSTLTPFPEPIRELPLSEAIRALERAGVPLLRPSLAQSLIFSLTGRGQEGMLIQLSPIAYAAWLGFLIHFLNLLPAWQLDGGHMARALLGRHRHRLTTMASVLVLLALNYWIMALFILLFSLRSVDLRPLDDVSPLSKRRKLIFFVGLFLALVSMPLPRWLV